VPDRDPVPQHGRAVLRATVASPSERRRARGSALTGLDARHRRDWRRPTVGGDRSLRPGARRRSRCHGMRDSRRGCGRGRRAARARDGRSRCVRRSEIRGLVARLVNRCDWHGRRRLSTPDHDARGRQHGTQRHHATSIEPRQQPQLLDLFEQLQPFTTKWASGLADANVSTAARARLQTGGHAVTLASGPGRPASGLRASHV
jgi:hypothetical protein